MRDEFRLEQLPKWEEMIKTLFNGDVPLEKEWHNLYDIVKVLDYVGKSSAANHTFLPNGGGLDLHGCTLSNEIGCIELNLGSIAHILKPKRLTFQLFCNAEYEWAYFLLETKTLDPSGVYESLAFNEEELVEISKGEYVERAYWDGGEYNGESLPDEARLVGRYLGGSLATLSKASLYNKNTNTYDGRHSKLSPQEFKNHIQKVVTHLQEEL
jgi:hypothetical protein